jgi:putative salt-induced outer membrane protein
MAPLPFLLPALLLSTAAAAQPLPENSALPEGVRAMIEAAIASGDPKTAETVIRLARETQPGAGTEIDALQERWRLRLAEKKQQETTARQAALAQGDILDHWKGQVEAGASRSTGRSSYFGLFGSLSFEREGIRWRHKLQGRAEIQDGRNVTDVERYVASWQPHYKLGDHLYAYGLTQFESDRVQGYDARYTAGSGLGYAVLTGPKARLDLEGGPAFRHVDAVNRPDYSSLAGRASLNFRWAVTPLVEVKQTSAVYFEEGESSANALTSVDARLLGPLRARFSYDVRWEDSLRSGRSSLDTLSRATLVYSF